MKPVFSGKKYFHDAIKKIKIRRGAASDVFSVREAKTNCMQKMPAVP